MQVYMSLALRCERERERERVGVCMRVGVCSCSLTWLYHLACRVLDHQISLVQVFQCEVEAAQCFSQAQVVGAVKIVTITRKRFMFLLLNDYDNISRLHTRLEEKIITSEQR